MSAAALSLTAWNMKKHTEARLEDAIIDHLTTQGGYVFVDYRDGEAKDRYDKARVAPAQLPGLGP